MRDIILGIVGRGSLIFDALRRLEGCWAEGRALAPGEEADRTGLVSRKPGSPPVFYGEDELCFVLYESFAHSLWRSQELSLFRTQQHRLRSPSVDLGSGDGSFASGLAGKVDCGIDLDPEGLRRAGATGVYRWLIRASGEALPLANASVRSIFANSVLEHVVDLAAVVSELRRVLTSDGLLIFTVPLSRYTEHLVFYFGQRAAAAVNRESSHRHLLSERAWRQLLEAHDFRVETVRHYQPPRFTFWYRMARLAGPRGLGRLFPQIGSWLWRWRSSTIVNLVRDSIGMRGSGANLFVVARPDANVCPEVAS